MSSLIYDNARYRVEGDKVFITPKWPILDIWDYGGEGDVASQHKLMTQFSPAQVGKRISVDGKEYRVKAFVGIKWRDFQDITGYTGLEELVIFRGGGNYIVGEVEVMT